MKLIILNAGDSFELGGFNKLLINHPKQNKNIIELYQDYFNVEKIEIVVGYRAIEIMNKYPNYHYIYNKKWQTTGSAYSLSLALDEKPCYVVPSDQILTKKSIELMNLYENCGLIKFSENKRLTSLNVIMNNNYMKEIYKGASKNNDPELLGVFKICNIKLLKEWKKKCIINSQGYAGQNLPLIDEIPIDGIEAEDNTFEINTPEDYISFLRKI